MSSAGPREQEDGRKASPVRMEESQEKNTIETDQSSSSSDKNNSPSSNDPDKSVILSSTTSRDALIKEGGDSKPSPGIQNYMRTDSISGKRKAPESPPRTSPQAKQARLEPKDAPEEARAAADDTQTESDDEYSSSARKSPTSMSDADEQKLRVGEIDSLEAKVAASVKDQQVPKESQDVIDDRLGRKVNRRVAFPVTMYQLLEDDDYKDACCWLPDGLSFAIDPDIFRKKVIDVHFRGSKFDSFKRKLNRWGFRRIMETEAPGTMTYYHRLFRRGFPALLKDMNGGRVISTKKKEEQARSMDEQYLAAAGQSFLPTDRSSDQDALLAALLRGGGAGLPGLGSLFGGGSTMGGDLASSMMGGAATQHQFTSAEGIPISLPPPMMSLEALQGADLERILVEQERVRLELVRKNQEELDLRQKLAEEVYRRKAQEDQMREILLTSHKARMPSGAPTSQGFPSQMPTDMMSRDPGLAASLPAGMLPGMPSSQLRAPTGLNQLQGASLNPFSHAMGLSQQYGSLGASLDPSASLAVAMPPGAPPAANEAELARFRSLNHQQGQGFERLVQEELSRRRQLGEDLG